jgi:hypothetical protein
MNMFSSIVKVMPKLQKPPYVYMGGRIVDWDKATIHVVLKWEVGSRKSLSPKLLYRLNTA